MDDFAPGREFPPATEEAWLEKARASLRGRDIDSLARITPEGLRIPPVLSEGEPLPLPARPAPLARGRGWAVMQRIEMSDETAALAQAREDLKGGADGLVMVSRTAPLAGGFGLADDDLVALLDALEPDIVPMRLDCGPDWPAVAGKVLALCGRRHLDLSLLPLRIAADPFCGPATGHEPADRKSISAALEELTRGGSGLSGLLAADTRTYHAAGCGDVQELALATAAFVEILRLLEERGHAPDRTAARVMWLMTADTDQFMTMARLRAARLLHARVLEVARLPFTPLRLHAESAWRMMTRLDVHVNMLRITSAAFAAGVGGADAVTLLPFTAALGLPDAFARRMARNAQIIALEEAGLDRVSDPARGSHFVDTLTRDLATRAWEIFRDIERRGGLLAALTSGFVADMIAEVAQRRAEDIATRRMPLTGVSEYPDLHEELPEVLAPAPATLSAAPAEGLRPRRLSEPFERLRDAASAFRTQRGRLPRAFLALAGSPHDPRITWTRNLLAAGGIDCVTGDPETCDPAETLLAVLCGSDDDYREQGARMLEMLRGRGVRAAWIAGKGSGLPVDRELHAGMNVLDALKEAHDLLEVQP